MIYVFDCISVTGLLTTKFGVKDISLVNGRPYITYLATVFVYCVSFSTVEVVGTFTSSPYTVSVSSKNIMVFVVQPLTSMVIAILCEFDLFGFVQINQAGPLSSSSAALSAISTIFGIGLLSFSSGQTKSSHYPSISSATIPTQLEQSLCPAFCSKIHTP